MVNLCPECGADWVWGGHRRDSMGEAGESKPLVRPPAYLSLPSSGLNKPSAPVGR